MFSRSRSSETHFQRRLSVALVGLVLALLWMMLLGGRALLDPDEGRYAEIPREMLTSGDWIIPHLDDLAYLEKPPLQYWATAIAYRALGVNEWTARLWTGLTSLLTIFAVYRFAAQQWDLRAGRWAAGILASSTLFLLMGHIITLDASLTFFLTVALTSFCRAQQHREDANALRRDMLLCWAGMALAVLTKGAIGVVIPGAVLALYTLWQRDWRVLQHLQVRRGLALFCVIVLPWFLLAAHQNSDFLRFFFVHEHLERFLTPSAERSQPWWFFGVIFAAGALPWLPQALRALRWGARPSVPAGHFDVRRLLWVWCIFVVIFFSASHSKLAPYILPMFPALALLIGSDPRAHSERSIGLMLAATATFAVMLVLAPLAAPWLAKRPDGIGALHALGTNMALIAAALVAGGGVAMIVLRRHGAPAAAATLGVVWFCALAFTLKGLGPGMPWLSGKALAREVPAANNPRLPLYTIEEYRHSLQFYWQRPLVPVHYRGELALGLGENPKMGVASLQDFERLWRAARDGLAIMPLHTWQQLCMAHLPMYVVAIDSMDVVVRRDPGAATIK